MHRNNEIKIIILKKEKRKRIGKGEKNKDTTNYKLMIFFTNSEKLLKEAASSFIFFLPMSTNQM